MDLKIEESYQQRKLQVGDVLVFNNVPYMIIKHRDGAIASIGKKSSYDFLNMKGEGYWIGDLSWDGVERYAKEADKHFSKDEYEFKLVRKCN